MGERSRRIALRVLSIPLSRNDDEETTPRSVRRGGFEIGEIDPDYN
jgi:hypothetical protein